MSRGTPRKVSLSLLVLLVIVIQIFAGVSWRLDINIPVSAGKYEPNNPLTTEEFKTKAGVSASLDKSTGIVEISKWNKESWIQFGKNSEEAVSEKIVDGKVDKYKLTYNEYTIQIYEIPSGLEYEIIIGKNPTSNIFTIPIATQNLAFYYQPELTQKEKDSGAIRPDNVIGSYAV